MEDPGDRANGPRAWPTLSRSVDMTNGTGMTIRVYTVDRYGNVINDRGVRTVPGEEKPLPTVQDTAFSSCRCPKCRLAVVR